MLAIHGQGCHACSKSIIDHNEIFKDRKFLVCSQCQGASYCNSTCQKAHWPEHKKQCPVFRDVKNILTEADFEEATDKMAMIGSLLRMRGFTDDSETFYVAARLPHCHVCFSMDVKSLKTCPDCHLRWACNKHWEKYRPKHKGEVCKTLQFADSC